MLILDNLITIKLLYKNLNIQGVRDINFSENINNFDFLIINANVHNFQRNTTYLIDIKENIDKNINFGNDDDAVSQYKLKENNLFYVSSDDKWHWVILSVKGVKLHSK